MKTKEEIIDDVADFIKTTALLEEVNGKLYTDEERPVNSKLEDVVISVLANNNGQTQRAIVNINIYFADQYRGNQYKKNRLRSAYLSRLCADIFEDDVHYNDFWLTLDEQNVIKIEPTHEHMVNNKIIYTIAN